MAERPDAAVDPQENRRILDDFLSLLDLEPLEANLFRGQSRDLGGKSVFGGQVLGQALAAAARTVEAETAHSLHAYFLRRGAMDAPIVYEVERIRDGRSFVTRRVQAIQHGRPIFSMLASFHRDEPGLTHQLKMPDVPPPEALESQHVLRARWMAQQQLPERLRQAFTRPLAIEFKPVQPINPLAPEAGPPRQQFWLRTAGKLPADATLHRCVLAYASDFNLLTAALLPHGRSVLSKDMGIASLDHALWFHRQPAADEWLLYDMDSPGAQGARGLSCGSIFNQAGELIASVAQESLMRELPPSP